jgi:trigger factor
MQTKIIERETVNARIEVQVPKDEVDKAYSGIFRSLAKQVRVDGFRPGKAPRRVLEARVGKKSIDEEVREALIEHFYPRAVKELELQPVHAHVDGGNPVEGEDYRFEVALELYPEVRLADYRSIVIDAEVAQLSEAQFESTVAAIRNNHATLVPVDRPVEPGDTLSVAPLTPDGETSGQNMPFDLERVDEEMAQSFYGKSSGDIVEITLPHLHPESDDDDSKTGEDGEDGAHATKLTVKILDIKAKEKPEAGDDLAKTLGYDRWQDAEEDIRTSLQNKLFEEGFNEQQEEFIDKIAEMSEVSLPQSLIDRQKMLFMDRLDRSLQRQGLSLESYLAGIDKDGKRQEFEAELEENAKKQVKRDVVLDKLVEERGVTVRDADFERALAFTAQQQQTSLAQLKKDLGPEGLANYRYLFSRDRAVRDSLRELLGGQPAEASAAKADEAGSEEAVGEEAVGEEAVGEKDIVEKDTGEKDAGEKDAGEKNIGAEDV